MGNEGRDARQRAFRLADQLMSPYCPGLLLSSCQSQGAHDLRAEIANRLARGESEEAVIADLVSRFGPGIRGAPETRGFGAVAWSTPAAVGVASLCALVVALVRFRTRRGGAANAPVDDADLSASTAERLDAELDALD